MLKSNPVKFFFMCENKLNAISNLELIEIPVKPSQLIYNIPDQPFLRSKKIVNIQVMTEEQSGISPLGNSVIPGTDLQVMYLTLWDGNKLRVRNMPFANLTTQPVNIGGQEASSTSYSNQSFNEIAVTWNKSQIIFKAPPSMTGSVLLQVWYLD